jgi:DMSO/TMAO reductase YedYZ molybdopterin-dependent catalytic subunit
MPVIICYKLNGEWLSPKRGGPVRMIVPEAYGFKSVKWLQRIVLTNDHRANDTYAEQNNDVDSWQKTMARFVDVPDSAKAGQAIPLTGLAQVSGRLREFRQSVMLLARRSRDVVERGSWRGRRCREALGCQRRQSLRSRSTSGS